MDAIHCNRYESLHIQLSWKDEAGSLDLGGREFLVLDAHPSALKSALHRPIAGQMGESEIYISTAVAAELGLGKANWIRVGVRNPGGELMTLPPIWIYVE